MLKSKAVIAGVLALGLLAASCASDDGAWDGTSDTTVEALPASIQEIMDKPQYADASWSLLVTDVETGETFYSLNADDMALTGSTRKLFSVGMALDTLGPEATQDTPVYRQGTVGADGSLDGDLVLVGSGDLAFGGRGAAEGEAEFTTFDHNDANNLGTAVLTTQDPLYAVDQLAKQVRESGITSVSGNVVVDDRLWEPYIVPNGQLLITPVMLNENMVDVTVTPTSSGAPADLEYRPETAAFAVDNQVTTTEAGTESDLEMGAEGAGLIDCIGDVACDAVVSGTIATDYASPFIGDSNFVGTLRVEEPNGFMRTAFIEALSREGVTVTSPPVTPNPAELLPATMDYAVADQVATYSSAPFGETATLILKVSLNEGANASLSLFGLEEGKRTRDGALDAERAKLTGDFGIDGDQFNFPTNGSGSPDSRATPKALVDLLIGMHQTEVADLFRHALPQMGVDGSLATSGKDLPAAGHVYAKTGTTVEPHDDGSVHLKAQNFAGYIETRSGRLVAYALMVNDAGELVNFAEDIGAVISDEATISNIIYESL